MESFLYAFFISESEAPDSNPRMLNGSNGCIWKKENESLLRKIPTNFSYKRKLKINHNGNYRMT